MSWNGTHPVLTKQEAKKRLPPKACKRCVYYVRCFPEALDHRMHQGWMVCRKCGVRI